MGGISMSEDETVELIFSLMEELGSTEGNCSEIFDCRTDVSLSPGGGFVRRIHDRFVGLWSSRFPYVLGAGLANVRI